jgi:hypothetical protein
MKPGKGWPERFAATLFCTLALSSCAKDPVVLSSEFRPSFGSVAGEAPHGAPCRVRLAEITDERVDAQSMGDIGGRPIRADTLAWVRSGLASLDGGGQITIVQAEPADLALKVELLKAYVISITTVKSANVVLRVRYAHGSSGLDDRIYRGSEVGPNWMSTTGETEAALNGALSQVLDTIREDTLTRCSR